MMKVKKYLFSFILLCLTTGYSLSTQQSNTPSNYERQIEHAIAKMPPLNDIFNTVSVELIQSIDRESLLQAVVGKDNELNNTFTKQFDKDSDQLYTQKTLKLFYKNLPEKVKDHPLQLSKDFHSLYIKGATIHSDAIKNGCLSEELDKWYEKIAIIYALFSTQKEDLSKNNV